MLKPAAAGFFFIPSFDTVITIEPHIIILRLFEMKR